MEPGNKIPCGILFCLKGFLLSTSFFFCLPEKGRKKEEEIEEIAEEMKESNREERGTGMKVKKQKK